MTVQQEKVTRRVVCRKCKSDQIVGNKRGYNFKRAFFILFLLLCTLITIGIVSNFLYVIVPRNSMDGVVGLSVLVGLLIILLGPPITLFSGFVGRKNIVNGCMNCGHTWMPKK
ncbi:hypothetical protein CN988_26560 [Bacillus thuringiensis]|uniref:hypothetical protein n=1 Tax=Bacillus thuringiensis TaxID=1428 RepID=UPI000BF8076C|nr:hypothetical protein [Bacillus thuringiensis]PES58059.1 hypothetical protein CN499_03185 [Bacillus thuringiensis]PEV49837.1 hypothetical protein CN426_04575 [Bacillus thuringiensis]PFE15209.1 hypothetical protein CN304_24440 [Bacillus thuringiensis]PFO30560.1 hypothetical protein COJ84_29920 [Bacillus thuringiensis]PFS07317.1 hypothetical protein COK60_05750 [Bacillus thuringiensis]